MAGRGRGRGRWEENTKQQRKYRKEEKGEKEEGTAKTSPQVAQTAWHIGARCTSPRMTGHVPNRPSYRDRKQVRCRCGGGVIAEGYRVSLRVGKMFSNGLW